MRRSSFRGLAVVLWLACSGGAPGPDGAQGPVVLGAEPFPQLPDGGAGPPFAALWVAERSADGALRAPAVDSVSVSCQGGCEVQGATRVAGGERGVLAIIVDDSGSNEESPNVCAGCPTDPDKKRAAGVKELARALLARAPQWRVGLFDFGILTNPALFDVTNHLAGYTSRAQDLVDAADRFRAGSGTPLYDSIAEVTPTAAGERVASFGSEEVPVRVLVISDGEDTGSRRALSAVLDAGAHLGVSVDCVGYGAVDGGVYPNLAGKAYRDLRTIALEANGFVALVDRDGLPALMRTAGEAYPSGWVRVVVSRQGALQGEVSIGGRSTPFKVGER